MRRTPVGVLRNLSPVIAGLALSGAAHFAPAETVAAAVSAAAPATSVQPDYHPSMGDLMTMAVQPRHTKLGLAGKQNNWPYASYELSELRNAFARIARTIPKYQTMDTAEMTTALTKAPLDALEQAIKKTNVTQFDAAYAQLTQACNVCHQSQKHAAIVIKAPDAAMFPDQDFRPAPR
jgi:hypothetical protein